VKRGIPACHHLEFERGGLENLPREKTTDLTTNPDVPYSSVSATAPNTNFHGALRCGLRHAWKKTSHHAPEARTRRKSRHSRDDSHRRSIGLFRREYERPPASHALAPYGTGPHYQSIPSQPDPFSFDSLVKRQHLILTAIPIFSVS